MKRLYQTSEFCPSPDPTATAFFWRSKEDKLLKVELAPDVLAVNTDFD